MSQQTFDSNIDYYSVLGLSEKATIEELKQAHIELALKFHPDTASASDQSDRNERFIAVTEAWKVLSNATIRANYDASRLRLSSHTVGSASRFSAAANPLSSAVSEASSRSINQGGQDMYDRYKSTATEDWKAKQRKYRTTSWRTMPLTERKAMRTLPIKSFFSIMTKFGLGFAALGTSIGIAAYSHYKGDHKF